MTKQAVLLAYLYAGRPLPPGSELISSALEHWMGTSPRFTNFVETYKDKIRKKVRILRTQESALDLLSELEVACGFLADRRLEVAYERYGGVKRRGPDFTVTYRSNYPFNVEVAHIHLGDEGSEDLVNMDETRIPGDAGAMQAGSSRIDPFPSWKVERVLLDKMGQMQPGMANLLVIHARQVAADSIDLGAIVASIKARIDRKEPAIFAGSHYASPAAFYKEYLRLSVILLWSTDPKVWINKQARAPLPNPVRNLVVTLLTQAESKPGLFIERLNRDVP